MRLDAQLRLCQNDPMDLQVFAPAELAGEAKRFLAPFEVNSIVSPMRSIQDAPLRGDRFLIYLSGREDEDQVTKPLKSFARVKRRCSWSCSMPDERIIGTLFSGHARRNARCRTTPRSVSA